MTRTMATVINIKLEGRGWEERGVPGSGGWPRPGRDADGSAGRVHDAVTGAFDVTADAADGVAAGGGEGPCGGDEQEQSGG